MALLTNRDISETLSDIGNAILTGLIILGSIIVVFLLALAVLGVRHNLTRRRLKTQYTEAESLLGKGLDAVVTLPTQEKASHRRQVLLSAYESANGRSGRRVKITKMRRGRPLGEAEFIQALHFLAENKLVNWTRATIPADGDEFVEWDDGFVSLTPAGVDAVYGGETLEPEGRDSTRVLQWIARAVRPTSKRTVELRQADDTLKSLTSYTIDLIAMELARQNLIILTPPVTLRVVVYSDDRTQYTARRTTQYVAKNHAVQITATGLEAVKSSSKPLSERSTVRAVSHWVAPAFKAVEAGRVSVLYLTSDASQNKQMRLDAEVSAVHQAVREAQHRDMIDIRHYPAATLADLLKGINDVRPQIVQFSGELTNGSSKREMNILANASENGRTHLLLARILAATDYPPKLLVLSGHETFSEADLLLRVCPVVIGISAVLDEDARSLFAAQFYRALASGQSLRSAIEQGRVTIDIAGTGDSVIRIERRPNTNLDDIRFI